MEKSEEDYGPLYTRGQARKLVWVELVLGGLWGPDIAGRIESRVRGLAGEKVPRRRDTGPEGQGGPNVLIPQNLHV